MEGRVCVVRSHSELSAIDKELLNDMCHGVEIYILKDTHITKCGGDRARFNTLIHNTVGYPINGFGGNVDCHGYHSIRKIVY